VINTNLPPILHRFRDTAFDRSKIARFYYPLVFNTPTGGVPLGRSPYNFLWVSTDGQGTKCCRNIVENYNRVSRVYKRYRQTDDRQTDGRQHITFAKKDHRVLRATHTFIHKWNEPYRPLTPAAQRRHTLAGTHFPFPLRIEG